MSETFNVALLTDDEIDTASTEALRKLATLAGLSGYETHQTVAEITLATELATSPGALTAVDKLFVALTAAYREAGRGPVLDQRYSGTLELKVWQSDDSVRYALKSKRDRANKEQSD